MKRIRRYIETWWRSETTKRQQAFLGLVAILALLIIFLFLWALSLCINVNVISAFVAVVLAFAAFLAIWNTSSIYRHGRQEQLTKGRRDRDERLLNEIIEWAIAIVKVGSPVESAVFVGPMDEEAERRLVISALSRLSNDFRAMIAISLYVSRIGLAFGEKLQSSIATLEADLRKQEAMVVRCQKIVVEKKLPEFDDAWKELIDNWGTLGDSAANVIDEAVIEKLTILNI